LIVAEEVSLTAHNKIFEKYGALKGSFFFF